MINEYRMLSIIITAIAFMVSSLFITAEDAIAVGVCEITIEKTALPDSSMEFEFSAPSPGPGNFNLSSGEQEMFEQIEFGNEVTVTEQVPAGSNLESVTCEVTGGNFAPVITDVENGVTIDCEGDGPPGQDPELSEITCAFVNLATPRPIPTLSQWGLMALAGIFILVGIWGISRKKAEA